MYQVSSAYRTAMKEPVQTYRLAGTVGTVRFTDADILSGSFSITNQCSDGTNVQIGQAYIGELSCTFLNRLGLVRRSLHGQEIKVSVGLLLGDGTYEDVPMGVFYISKADWSASGVVVTAYDAMSKLDKKENFTAVSGTAYDLAQLSGKACGVSLGTAEYQFQSFANGNVTMTLASVENVSTYRDLLAWIAQALGANVMADRDGKIVFRDYSTSSVDTVDDTHRLTGGSFSDFVTRYSGLFATNMDGTRDYYKVTPDSFLSYDLGANPLLQQAGETDPGAMRRSVLASLQKVRYTPFSCSVLGNPAYDLMDVLYFSGGLAGTGLRGCITKYTWHHNGKFEMEGVGTDPALMSAESKAEKAASGASSSGKETGSTYGVYTNAEEVDVSDGVDPVSCVFVYYVSLGSYFVHLDAEILMDVSSACEVTAYYYLDEVLVEERRPVVDVQAGHQYLRLHYSDHGLNAATHLFEMKLSCSGGSLKIAAGGVYMVLDGIGLKRIGSAGEVMKIEVTRLPDKLTYLEKEDLDTTGIQVTATYFNHQTAAVTEACTFSPTSFSESGIASVMVSYTEGADTVTTSFDVTVKAFAELEITHDLTKKVYFRGEKLDLSGLVVTAVYTDGTRKDVTKQCSFEPASGTPLSEIGEDQELRITYEEDGNGTA